MKQAPREVDLGQAEQQTIRDLDPELQEHSALAQSGFDLSQELLASVPEMQIGKMPQSLKVAIALLARLANDLRCAALLAHRGYEVQACTLVASMYEVAFTVAFIGSDNTLAQSWVDHDDPTNPFRNVMTMTREGLRKLDLADPAVQTPIEYRTYSQLCMARHANPLFQMEHSFRKEGDAASPMIGPDVSKEAVKPAQFALEHSVHLATLAMFSFLQEHLLPLVPEDEALALRAKIEALAESRKSLEAKGKQRWGTEDPFPDKWRK